MGERKVINKYYPYDFDPLKLRKPKLPEDRQVRTRMMLPFTCKCILCGTYLHIGTKFNMRMEIVQDEEYLGIEIRRFYFKCSRCASEITMKTDPKNHDYLCESGAIRQYDERRDLEAASEMLKALKSEDQDDPMRFLEARTFETRREMDIMDALNELMQLNKIQADVNFDEVLQNVRQKRMQYLEEELGIGKNMTEQEKSRQIVRRIDEEEEDRRRQAKRRKLIQESLKPRRKNIGLNRRMVVRKVNTDPEKLEE